MQEVTAKNRVNQERESGIFTGSLEGGDAVV